jgi:hypothetical protein
MGGQGRQEAIDRALGKAQALGDLGQTEVTLGGGEDLQSA